MFSRSSATVPSLVGLGFHPPPGRAKMLSVLSVCLSVYLSIMLLTMKALEYRNDFDALRRGRFVVVHPCSTFSDCC